MNPFTTRWARAAGAIARRSVTIMFSKPSLILPSLIFPLLFVLLFMSSGALPRDLIQNDWFQTIATINPVSYLIEGVRSLMITGWDPEALALAFGIAIATPKPSASAWRSQPVMIRLRSPSIR